MRLLIQAFLGLSSLFGFELDEAFKKDSSKFKGKKIGYYIGSFDPFHKGHEAIVDSVLERGLVDFVLVCPAYGADTFKNRSDVLIRIQMLEALYKNHARVMYTKMSPKELQDYWVKHELNHLSEVVGILGVDAAIATQECSKRCQVFMSGMPIPKKYEKHTVGNLIALRASAFCLVERDGYQWTHRDTFLDRKILKFIKTPFANCSSTQIRGRLRQGQSVQGLISQKVLQVVQTNELYLDTLSDM